MLLSGHQFKMKTGFRLRDFNRICQHKRFIDFFDTSHTIGIGGN